jgi:hypothetical protein
MKTRRKSKSKEGENLNEEAHIQNQALEKIRKGIGALKDKKGAQNKDSGEAGPADSTNDKSVQK